MGRVPPAVWAAVVAAAIIGGVQLVRPEGERVAVVGAGPAHQLSDAAAPEGVYYDIDTTARETLTETEARVDDAVRLWPAILVLGVDGAALGQADAAEARAILTRIVVGVDNAGAVPVVLLPPLESDRAAADLARWLRDDLCERAGMQLCVELPVGAGAAEVASATAGAMPEARYRMGFDSPTTMPAR